MSMKKKRGILYINKKGVKDFINKKGLKVSSELYEKLSFFVELEITRATIRAKERRSNIVNESDVGQYSLVTRYMTFVVIKDVRERINKLGYKLGGYRVIGQFDMHVNMMLIRAIDRTRANKRKTIMEYDL